MNTKIRVIDSPMGSGKTCYIFKEIDEHPDQKYIYVTPYIKECERIQKNINQHSFKLPVDKYCKQTSLEELLRNGEDVAISHKLFMESSFSKQTREAIHNYGYSLILDEEIDVIEPVQISEHDINILIESKCISISETDKRVIWMKKDYKGKYKTYKSIIENGSVIYYRNKLFLWILPAGTLQYFSEITIMTFMFIGSHLDHYLRKNNYSYDLFYIDSKHVLVNGMQDLTEFKRHAAGLISIYDGKLNNVGELETSLSASWYKNSKVKQQHIVLANNARTYFEKVQKCKVDNAIWTMFKSNSNDTIKKSQYRYPVRNYITCDSPCNCRATNEYSHKHCAAYLINVYDHPFIQGYFRDFGISVDNNLIALSRMLQWIWRTGIRNGEPINIYIPSSRMRRLLTDWLNDRAEQTA